MGASKRRSMHKLSALVFVLFFVPFTAADGQCPVTKVRAVCDYRCEQDTRPVDRTSVPPPGTLLPPSGIFKDVEEGNSPPPAQNNPTPADSSSLLELESTAVPGVTITKTKKGAFKKENVAKATYQ